MEIDIESEREASEELYKSVVDFVRQTQRASTSHIQRTYKLQYMRASDIVDKLEEDFVVSPMDSKGRRYVYPEIISQWKTEIDDLKAQLEAIKSEKCVWREHEFFGTFHTDCDNLFELSNEDSLVQNTIYYCPFCGKKIDEDFGESEDD